MPRYFAAHPTVIVRGLGQQQATRLLKGIRQRVRVRTGRLKRSFRVAKIGETRYSVGTRVIYAPYVEARYRFVRRSLNAIGGFGTGQTARRLRITVRRAR